MMNRYPRRVLWVTSSFPRWVGDNTAPFMIEMADGLLKSGWTIDVIAPHGPGLLLEEQVGTVRVYRFRYMLPEQWQTLFYKGGALGGLGANPLKFLLLPLTFIAMFFAILHRVKCAQREGKPYALIHSHWLLPQGLIAGLASRWVHLAHVATSHGSDLMKLRGRLFVWLKRVTLNFVDGYHVVSPNMIDIAIELGSDYQQIPMGVNISALEKIQSNIPDTEKPIVYVGRLSEEKGPDVLVRGIAFLEGEASVRQIIFVGDGPKRAEVESLARSLNVADKVTFVGGVSASEARQWIANAAVVVMPSRSEGVGMVSLEAMSIGTPVIATDVGGMSYSLNQGRAGCLVPPENPQALAQALSNVFSDHEATAAMCACAHQYVRQNFALSAVGRQLSALYEKAIDGFSDRNSCK
ncbi:MAG: glycosyltransferase family 4 protein [Kordiimonadaceae bacterium]|nr:glycosyltransferase family 4 protein [Kordiimonadaceae bacterium]